MKNYGKEKIMRTTSEQIRATMNDLVAGEYLPAPQTEVVALLSDIPRNIRSDDGRLPRPNVMTSYTKMVEPLPIDGAVAKSFRNAMPDIAIANL